MAILFTRFHHGTASQRIFLAGGTHLSFARKKAKRRLSFGRLHIQKTGMLVGEKLKKTLMTSWLNKAADPHDPQILGYIDKCEPISTESFSKESRA